jgi:hypothetical protein
VGPDEHREHKAYTPEGAFPLSIQWYVDARRAAPLAVYDASEVDPAPASLPASRANRQSPSGAPVSAQTFPDSVTGTLICDGPYAAPRPNLLFVIEMSFTMYWPLFPSTQ